MVVINIIGALILYAILQSVCDMMTDVDYIIAIAIGLILAFGFDFGIGDEYKIYFVLTGIVIWFPIKLIYIWHKEKDSNKRMATRLKMIDFILSIYPNLDKKDLLLIPNDKLYEFYLKAKQDYIEKEDLTMK